MKNLFLSALITLSTQAFSGSANFAGLVKDDSLFLTIKTDGCNSYRVGLEVDGSCNDDRLTANYAETCYASTTVLSTKKACPAGSGELKTFEINLKESKVAREAKLLVLKHSGESIEIEIK
jgi:hypothetical protein